MIYVKTGSGGGKTTSAMGLALRALGHGKRVVIIQFMKGRLTGEMIALKRFNNCDFKQFGRECFVNLDKPDKIDKELAIRGLSYAEEVINSKPFMIILDEINLAARIRLITVKRVVKLIKKAKKLGIHLILTGRFAPKTFINLSDFATNYNDIKRHDITAREGIEY